MKVVGILGKKMQMTQLPNEAGELKPATPV